MSRTPEDFAQLVADDVDDGLEVELGADAALDRMDQREFGVAQSQLLAQCRPGRPPRRREPFVIGTLSDRPPTRESPSSPWP
jgi:hypothetical protein